MNQKSKGNQSFSSYRLHPFEVRGVGIEPTVSSFRGWRITAFLPPEWTARDSHPHFRRAGPASFCWTSSPVSGEWSEVRSQRVRLPISDLCLLPILSPLTTHHPPHICGGRIRTGVERLMRPCW
jgi:hypothetical protein